MALPVPESAAGPREDIIRLLTDAPEGLSDGELATALAVRHPGLSAKAVNHQCRRLVAAGIVQRVGTRPVRTRLLPGAERASSGSEDVTAVAEHSTRSDEVGEVPGVPLAGGAAATGLPPVQAAIVRALADAPAGLTDVEVAAALADTYPDLDPKAFNYQCRKLAKAGLVERSARSKNAAIRTRLVPADAVDAADARPRMDDADAEGHTTRPDPAPDLPHVPLDEPDALAQQSPADRPRRRAKTPSDDVARIRRSERDDWAPDDPDEPLLRFLPFAPAASARTALRERMAERAAVRRVAEPSAEEVVVPTRDVLQGWSRTQNVAAAVASWLTRHGATIRAAHALGPAHDLVATLHGDDVHVEVTGWPPDGARSHPTTLAGDWFHAAARAASQRRRAHPHGRVVVALPDTRRYRALAGDAEVLRRARAEVWFVDPSGEVQLG